MNVNYSTTAQAEKLPDRKFAAQWNSMDWKQVEAEINGLQIRIAKAAQAKQWNRVKRLQYLITHSYYAKVLAVRKVTTNKGKNTAGIDKIVWQSPSDKMRAALSLSDKNYKAKPLRRVYIEKKGKKSRRPLSIPAMYDRAMQALYAMALQPVAETTADPNSYGFRKYRSCQDACEHIFTALSRKYSPQWVLEGDIKGCFDNISHEWLIDNIPMDKSVLKQFLKCGYVYDGELYSSEDGTPQGGVISPILANMALDGIQNMLAENFDTSRKGNISSREHKKHKVNFIRYADDFIVTAINEETATQAKRCIKEYLAQRGLQLSEEKTFITNINEGFDFLGWNFRKFKEKLIIKPSDKSIKSLTDSLHETIIQKGRTLPQKIMIHQLNQKLTGWGNYHKSVCSKVTFQKVDRTVFILLWKWACHRHPRKGRRWIKEKYWHTKGSRNWVFATDEAELRALSYIPIVRHPKLKLSENPYINQQYFIERSRKIPIEAKTIV